MSATSASDTAEANPSLRSARRWVSGLKHHEFRQEFNRSADMEPGCRSRGDQPQPTAASPSSPDAAEHLFLKAAKIDRQPDRGQGATVGRVTRPLREIAEQKMKDMNANDIERPCACWRFREIVASPCGRLA